MTHEEELAVHRAWRKRVEEEQERRRTTPVEPEPEQVFYKPGEKEDPQAPGFVTHGGRYGDWMTSQMFRARKARRRAQSKNARAARRRNRSKA